MIKNLIFDIGGVIFEQDTDEAKRRFADIGLDPEYYMGHFGQKDFFLELESGVIDDQQFIKKVAQVRGRDDLSWSDMQYCWLGFVRSVRDKCVRDLEELRKRYHIAVLSNTNPFAMAFMRSPSFCSQGRPITDFVDEFFLSYEMKVCKPSPEIFERMLSQSGMVAGECLFIDDSRKNTDSARAFGLETLYVPTNSDWMPALEAWLNELNMKKI